MLMMNKKRLEVATLIPYGVENALGRVTIYNASGRRY